MLASYDWREMKQLLEDVEQLQQQQGRADWSINQVALLQVRFVQPEVRIVAMLLL